MQRSVVRAGVWTAVVMFVYGLVLTGEELFQGFDASLHLVSLGALLAGLFFAQVQNVLVSTAAGVLTPLFCKKTWLRIVWLVIVSASLFFMAANHLYMTVFSDHYRPGAIEGEEVGIEFLQDSILFEIKTPVFIVNICLAVLLTALLAWVFFKKPRKDAPPDSRVEGMVFVRWGTALAVVAAAWGFSARMVSGKVPATPYTRHPLAVLLLAVGSEPLHARPTAPDNGDILTLRHGTPGPTSPEARSALAQIRSRFQDGSLRNVVMMIVESVGSLQILNAASRPDPVVTPYLASKAGGSVIFPLIYNNFPGTVRTHVPIFTGGRTVTWGSVYEEYGSPYKGPTIASEMKAANLRTGLFSASFMEAENLGGFYKNLPWDQRFYPDDLPKNDRRRRKISSWCIDERVALREGLQWVEKSAEPFFLALLTCTTHHPYYTPPDHKSPWSRDGSRWDRYRDALSFLDAVVKEMFESLEKLGVADKTLVAIMGDHGQAFGNFHRGNLTHKNYLYEENIRNFLMLIPPGATGEPVIFPQIGAVGDIAPTLLSLTGRTGINFAGRDLSAEDFQERVVYFHKNAHPEKWGLRDGQWKFVARKIGGRLPELYDLSQDPMEKVNLAPVYPERVQEYGGMAARWYVDTNDDFLKHIPEFRKPGDIRLTGSEVQTFGPKRLVFGTKDENSKFKELPRIHPEEDMVAWTFGVPFPDNTKLEYHWTSPSGKVRSFPFTFDKEWSTVQVYHRARSAMEPGTWNLKISLEGTVILTGDFIVDPEAPVIKRRKF